MKQSIKKWITRMRNRLPVSRKRYDNAIRQKIEQRKQMQRAFDHEFEKANESIRVIVERLSHLDWHRVKNDRYILTLTFEPRLMQYGAFCPQELKYIADYMAHKVRGEIVTAKFITRAMDNEFAPSPILQKENF